jgi:hypothetical protein
LAKIVITLEDTATGGVKIVSNPTFETIAKMINSGGDDITSAHGYAVAMMNTARRESKSSAPSTTIWLPKVKRL